MAVRAVFDTYEAHPDLPIIGVGGIAATEDIVEFLLAGASAVQVGTATFADPAAAKKLLADLQKWCSHHRVGSITDLIGGAHHSEDFFSEPNKKRE